MLGEGVEGQKLECRPKGDVEDRFWSCVLDGTRIPIPTNRIEVEMDKDDQVSGEVRRFGINDAIKFKTDEPRIHVECKLHTTRPKNPDINESCVLEVRDAEE